MNEDKGKVVNLKVKRKGFYQDLEPFRFTWEMSFHGIQILFTDPIPNRFRRFILTWFLGFKITMYKDKKILQDHC